MSPVDAPWLVVFLILLGFAAFGLAWHIIKELYGEDDED